METYSCIEHIHQDNLKRMIASKKLPEETLSTLRALKKATKASGCHKVEFALKVENRKGVAKGRLYSKYNKACLTTESITRDVRKALAHHQYSDLDMKNCHPVVMNHIFKTEKISCPSLDRYVSERDTCLQETGMDRDEAKLTFVALMNGHKPKDNHTTFLKQFHQDMAEASTSLFKLAKYEPFLKLGEVYKPYNAVGWAVSQLATDHERRGITIVKNFFEERGYDLGTIIHDGMLIRHLNIPQSDIKECEEALQKHTGFPLELSVKPMDDYDPEKLWDTEVEMPPDEMNDSQGAKAFTKAVGLRSVWCAGAMYWYNPEEGLWTTDTRPLRVMMMECDKLTPEYQGDYKKQMCLIKQLEALAPTDDDFFAKAPDTTYRKLPFANGVYDFKKKSLVPYSPDMVFHYKLPFDYTDEVDEELVEDIKSKVIHGVFGEEQGEYYLRVLARAMAGEVVDKTLFVIEGKSNSGKGANSELLQHTFGKFIGNFNTGCLAVAKQQQEDRAKAMSWLVDLMNCRFALANECSMKGNIDGNAIKMFASGGDRITARKNHKDEITFKMTCTLSCWVNDLPDIDACDDAVANRLAILKTQYTYLTGERYEQLKNQPKVRKGDDSIKTDFITRPEVQQTFAMMVMRSYEDNKPERPECVVAKSKDRLEVSDVNNLIKELFVSTGKDTDFVGYEQMFQVVKREQIQVSKSKMKEILIDDMGIHFLPQKKIQGRNMSVFVGIQLIQDGFADF